MLYHDGATPASNCMALLVKTGLSEGAQYKQHHKQQTRPQTATASTSMTRTQYSRPPAQPSQASPKASPAPAQTNPQNQKQQEQLSLKTSDPNLKLIQLQKKTLNRDRSPPRDQDLQGRKVVYAPGLLYCTFNHSGFSQVGNPLLEGFRV